MSHEIKSASDNGNLAARIQSFRDCMGPALHLFPTDTVDRLTQSGFFTAPASTKYHGCYEGGLFEHSLNATYALVGLTKDNKLTWSRPESPYIIGMFHDICKQDQYRHPFGDTLYSAGVELFYTVDESRWEYEPDTLLKGHGDKSVMLLSQYLQLTMEEILCIRYHMGAFVDQKEWNDYTRAIHECPNVLWTHTADMIAAHILEIDK